jgi:hypothetical protein
MSVTDELSFDKVTAYIDKAVENGTLAVFCFHGIGGDYIVTSREYHQRIIIKGSLTTLKQRKIKSG